MNPERPWLGLRSFDESTRAYFFGRDAEIRDLFERVEHRPLTVLFGQSGLGKTSLLRAGLVPRLRDAGCAPRVIRIDYAVDAPSPEAQIVDALGKTVGKSLPCGVPLWLLLHDPEYGLCGTGDAAGRKLARPVLVLDQFEEVFTLGAQRAGAAGELQAALAAIAENRAPDDLDARLTRDDALALRIQYDPARISVVISLREDFLHFIERWKRAIPAVMENRMELRLLSGPQAFRAVVEPGKMRSQAPDGAGPGRRPIVDEMTATAIVRFVAGAAMDVPLEEIDNVPPLLSLICAQLNERRFAAPQDTVPKRDDVPIEWVRVSEAPPNAALKTEAPASRSAAEEALEQFYSDSFELHPTALRHFIEDKLISDAGFRETVTLDGAIAILRQGGVADPAAHLSQLVDNRVLVIEDHGGIARIELTHDILAALALGSRRERKQKDEAERRALELAEARREARFRAFVTGLMLILALGAGVGAWIGWQEAAKARSEAKRADLEALRAKQQERAAIQANEENRRNLHDRSMADYAVAVDRIEKDGKWSEGIAHLARALDWDPGNVGAAASLYTAMAYFAPKEAAFPRTIVVHEDVVYRARFSPDGARIVTASEDKTARVWDVATGEPLGEPMRHEAGVSAASFSPDGARIVTACGDSTVRVWDAATGKPLGEPMRHENTVNEASFSPDGGRIVTASWDHTARVWDAATGKPLGEPIRHEDTVYSASFSSDGAWIVTASGDHTARIWDAATGRPLGEPVRHEDAVQCASFSPEGSRIVTASWDHTAIVWDLATGKPLGEPMRHPDIILSASFSPDGARIVTASGDHTARIWDAATGKPLGGPLRHEEMVISASFSPDGARIVTASRDKTARLWDAGTGAPPGEPLRHENAVFFASFSPDGVRIVTASDKTARMWDTVTGKPLGEPMRHENFVNFANFSPDGVRIVTASIDKTARIWDAATGKPLGEPMRHEDAVYSASFSPEGSRIVTASVDKTARVWDAATGKPLGEPMRHEAGVSAASFSPDGARIVTASGDTTARVWDAATGKPLGEPMRHGNTVNDARFSPEGSRIVTACWDRTAQVWDAATGKPLGEPLRHDDVVQSASFSDDGARIVTASNDKTARVWDAATGKPLGEPMRHEDAVYSASFSPDGARIVTASADRTARIWDVRMDLRLLIPAPQWVREWAQALPGLHFDADGVLQPLSGLKRLEILSLRHQGNDPWSRLAQWMAMEPGQRTIHPGSSRTCREIAERERDFGSREALESALRYDTTLPLARVLLSQFEKDPYLAASLRRFDERRLPDDAMLLVRASSSLLDQNQPKMALNVAQRALRLAPMLTRARRALAAALDSANQKAEALTAYEGLLSSSEAIFGDFTSAGFLAATLGNHPRSREIFHLAEEKFPNDPDVLRIEGLALVDSKLYSDALKAFARYESMLPLLVEPSTDAVAGMAVSRWLTGDKQGAISTYQRLISLDASFSGVDFIGQLTWGEFRTRVLAIILGETLRRHPELKPKADRAVPAGTPKP